MKMIDVHPVQVLLWVFFAAYGYWMTHEILAFYFEHRGDHD
jgi:hypothetical protein